MKNIHICLFFLLLVGSIQAQEKAAVFKYDNLRHSLSFGLNGNKTGAGADIKYILNYRFNSYLHLGIGTGIDSYLTTSSDEPITVTPVFTNIRGTVSSWKVRPYYATEIGLGFPFKNGESAYTQSFPSLYFRPHLGWEFRSKGRFAFNLGMGYLIQRLKIVHNFSSIDYKNERTKTITFQRPFIRLGFDF